MRQTCQAGVIKQIRHGWQRPPVLWGWDLQIGASYDHVNGQRGSDAEARAPPPPAEKRSAAESGPKKHGCGSARNCCAPSRRSIPMRPTALLASSSAKSSSLRTGCQQVTPAIEGGEPVDKPGSVASNHSSRAIVANCLQRPTRDRRGPRHRPPIWPCSGRECLAGPVARARGALLPHPFTLAKPQRKLDGWRSALCCTCRRLAPPRDYLAPCPVEPGLSSGRLSARRRHAVA